MTSLTYVKTRLERWAREQVDMARRLGQQVGNWLADEFGELGLCLLCVYAGVQSFYLIPAAVIVVLMPGVPPMDAALTPLAAVPVAAVVFDVRAERRWKRARLAPLWVRMLRAYSDGVLWPLLWRDER